ncbi:MAG: hypothetical protein PF489_00965 [Salinivirgaceae bacterium]|jgi:mono/diheme cytochrome c family protein|nr:hypothetical protein [Salinivirgaceae bacterium]
MKYLIICIITLSLFTACENEDEDENETVISQNYSDESHNLSQNCMNCHVQGEGGEGWFTVAGSLYEKTQTSGYPNGSVKITSEPNASGTTIKTIEVDSKGNFYTTQTIDFGNGLYVSVYGTNGEEKIMMSKINTGSCNSCHGNTTDKIWLE